jgi:hypothetical protein
VHNAATLNKSLDPATATAFAWQGVDRVPYAPCHIKAERDSSDDVLISWSRRDRVGQELEPTLLLSEASEAYEVDIYDTDTTTILRTIEVTAPEAMYTEAMQFADFGSELPISVDVAVYQIGALGRGYPARITIPIED